jgi:hypothetical protein
MMRLNQQPNNNQPTIHHHLFIIITITSSTSSCLCHHVSQTRTREFKRTKQTCSNSPSSSWYSTTMLVCKPCATSIDLTKSVMQSERVAHTATNDNGDATSSITATATATATSTAALSPEQAKAHAHNVDRLLRIELERRRIVLELRTLYRKLCADLDIDEPKDSFDRWLVERATSRSILQVEPHDALLFALMPDAPQCMSRSIEHDATNTHTHTHT